MVGSKAGKELLEVRLLEPQGCPRECTTGARQERSGQGRGGAQKGLSAAAALPELSKARSPPRWMCVRVRKDREHLPLACDLAGVLASSPPHQEGRRQRCRELGNPEAGGPVTAFLTAWGNSPLPACTGKRWGPVRARGSQTPPS